MITNGLYSNVTVDLHSALTDVQCMFCRCMCVCASVFVCACVCVRVCMCAIGCMLYVRACMHVHVCGREWHVLNCRKNKIKNKTKQRPCLQSYSWSTNAGKVTCAPRFSIDGDIFTNIIARLSVGIPSDTSNETKPMQ